MFQGLRRRKFNRTLTRMDVSDNLIDPLLTEAVMTFLDIKRCVSGLGLGAWGILTEDFVTFLDIKRWFLGSRISCYSSAADRSCHYFLEI